MDYINDGGFHYPELQQISSLRPMGRSIDSYAQRESRHTNFTVNEVTSSEGPKKDDWNDYKYIISDLYRTKGLKATMMIMEKDHKFKATYAPLT